MRSAVLAGYGAAWFAGCKTVKANNHCNKDLDYDSYNFYLQLANSIMGLFSFLSAGVVGYLSDKYGRKPFLYFHNPTWLPYIPILFLNNMYVFFAVLPLMGLNGSIMTLCPAQNGFIADSLPPHRRLKGFSTVYTIGGTSLFFGVLLSYGITKIWNDHTNFYIINALFLINLFYLKIFVSEPDKNEYKHEHVHESENEYESGSLQPKSMSCNPCRPLKHLCNNSVVLWIALSSSMVSFQNQGILDIAIVVFSNAFPNNDQDLSNTIALLFMSGLTFGLIIGPLVIVPFLKKVVKNDEYKILLFTLILLLINCVAMCIVVIIAKLWMVFISATILGVGILSFATYNSLLTQYVDNDEIGMGLGVMFACNSGIGIGAPFGFAVGHKYFESIGFQYGIFVVAFGLGFIGLMFSIPLKLAINKREKK